MRHSNIATWTQVSSGANQWNLLFKWSMPKSKPCFNILEKLEPNAKSLSCGVDYNFFSPLLAKLVLWWATRNCSSVKMLLIMTCLTLTIWMVTQFFSLCVNSCLRAQTRQLICFFWLELEKTTVFFYTNIICKAFSFYANFSLTVAMYMADLEMEEALKSAGLKSTWVQVNNKRS